MKCDKCRANIIAGNDKRGIPNGITFEMKNGKKITLCKSCITLIGVLTATNSKKGIEMFYKEIGVDVNKQF